MKTKLKFLVYSIIFNFLLPIALCGQDCEELCSNQAENPMFEINTTSSLNLKGAIFNGFVDDWSVALNIPHLIYIQDDGICYWGSYNPATENEDLQTCLFSRWIPTNTIQRGYFESVYQEFTFISDPFITYEICIDAKNLECGVIEDQSHLKVRAINDIVVNSPIFHESVPPVLPGSDFQNIGNDIVTGSDFDTYTYTFQPNSDFNNLEIINAVEVPGSTFMSIDNLNVNCSNSGLTGIELEAMDQIVHFTALYQADEIDIVNYEWNFDDGFTSTDASPTHMYVEYGTYEVCLEITDEYGCCAQKCVTVEIIEPPISCPVDENTLYIDAENPMTNSFSDLVEMGLYSEGGTISNVDIVIKGEFTMDKNFTFDNCNFYFEPGSEFVIQSPGNIVIKNSEFLGCSEMWKGITVQGPYVITIPDPFGPKTALFMNNNIIRDAYAGIEIKEDVDMYLGKTLFEDNYMGIYSAPSSTTKKYYGLPINECTFQSSGSMLPEYNGQPDWSVRPFAGLFINDLSNLKIVGNSLFTGLTNGVLAKNCNLTCKESIFKNIADTNNTFYSAHIISTSRGIAIRIESSMVVDIEDNYFEDCVLGIYIVNPVYNDLSIHNNEFIDDTMLPITPVSMIDLRHCNNGSITVRNNKALGLLNGGLNFHNINNTEQLEIRDNEVNMKDRNCMEFINVYPSANSYAFVTNNKLTSEWSAFWLTNNSNLSIENNRINEGNPVRGTGFRIENTTNSHFRDNKLYLDYPGYGFRSIASSYNLYCCNELYEPNWAFEFIGQSNPSTLTTNTTTFDETIFTPSRALMLRDAQIGPHDNKGNKWIGGSWTEANIFATNEEDFQSIADNSQFRTDFEIPGLKPRIIKPMDIENTWWVDFDVAPPTCASMPDCNVPKYELTPPGPSSGDDCDKFRTYIEALLGPKLAGAFKDQNDWALYYFAFNYLQDVPEELWEGCAHIVNFMNSVDTEIKIFNETDKSINRAFALSTSEKTRMANAVSTIKEAKSDMETIFSNFLNTDGATPDNMIASQLIINDAIAQMDAVRSNVRSNGTTQLINTAQTINSITTSHAFQALLLDVWQIKIDILLNGATSLSQSQLDDLNTIANSCILENGQAAFEARGILNAYFDIDEFVEVDVACAAVRNRFAATNSELELKVYPNPSDGQFFVDLENENSEAFTLEVMNANGTTIMQKKNANEIDLERYSPGVYLLRLTTEDGRIYHQKLLKVK